MGSSKKQLQQIPESESEMGSEEEDGYVNEISEEEFEGSDYSNGVENEGESSDESEGREDDEEEEEDGDRTLNAQQKDDEIQELEKEYRDLQTMEQSLIQNLKRHKDEDLVKGQAIKNQKALWDKTLEFRFLLQKPFSKSNKLPQEPIRSSFCEADEDIAVAYTDLIVSSRKAIESLVHLQEALVDNNPSIGEETEGGSQFLKTFENGEGKMDLDKEEEWLQISQVQSRVAPFRNSSIDKWQRKADVHSGAAAKKVKLVAFNQNISEQVATYMRDPSKLIKSMQTRRETVGVFGAVAKQDGNINEEGNHEGDPELLDDAEFYQQLLKEFFETIDPNSSESAFYALKRLQTKKRKVVDRRASKSRKIRYHVHEKIVNFMAPEPMELPPMAPKLFENLFGLKTPQSTPVA